MILPSTEPKSWMKSIVWIGYVSTALLSVRLMSPLMWLYASCFDAAFVVAAFGFAMAWTLYFVLSSVGIGIDYMPSLQRSFMDWFWDSHGESPNIGQVSQQQFDHLWTVRKEIVFASFAAGGKKWVNDVWSFWSSWWIAAEFLEYVRRVEEISFTIAHNSSLRSVVNNEDMALDASLQLESQGIVHRAVALQRQRRRV